MMMRMQLMMTVTVLMMMAGVVRARRPRMVQRGMNTVGGAVGGVAAKMVRTGTVRSFGVARHEHDRSVRTLLQAVMLLRVRVSVGIAQVLEMWRSIGSEN